MTQNFSHLTPAQERDFLFRINQMLSDGRYQKMLFALAHAEQRFMEKLDEGNPGCTPVLAQGFDALLLLLEVPLVQ